MRSFDFFCFFQCDQLTVNNKDIDITINEINLLKIVSQLSEKVIERLFTKITVLVITVDRYLFLSRYVRVATTLIRKK